MMFCGGEMVFHRLEIRSKAINVAEINRKIIKGVKSSAEGQSDLGTFVVPSPDGDMKSVRCM